VGHAAGDPCEVEAQCARCEAERRREFDQVRELFDRSRNVVLAIRPGGRGDVTETHVVWEHTRNVPFCASPLYYRGRLFTVKDGGILTCLDAESGSVLKLGRLRGTGSYYASPIAGDGKVYLLNQQGQLTVISADGEWQTLFTSDFGEDVYATPALVDGKIYLRTAGHLYCFGLADGE
jgi:outer membrane protein assembly factor BamB